MAEHSLGNVNVRKESGSSRVAKIGLIVWRCMMLGREKKSMLLIVSSNATWPALGSPCPT
jgi:hypothetical protein